MVQRTVECSARAAGVNVEVRRILHDRPAEARNHFSESCFISFALAPRPAEARGRYEEIWQPARSEVIGDVMFVPAGVTMVGTCAPGALRDLACHLDAALFHLPWSDLDERAYVEALGLRSDTVKRGLRRLLQEVSSPMLGSPLALEATAMLLAIDIERHLTRIGCGDQRKKGGLTPSRLRRMEERIRSDLPLPTLSELATICDLSVRHLARAFRQETGRAIGEFVTAAGRERAHRLLATTDLPISDIAAQVGFSSAASFAYAFRQATGERPSDVRRRSRH